MQLEIRSFRTRVARRIFVLFMLCSFLPISALSVASYLFVRNQLHEQSRERLRQENKAIAVSLYERLILARSEMRLLSSEFASGRAGFTENQRRIFRETLQERFNGLTLVFKDRLVPLYGPVKDIPVLVPDQQKHLLRGNALLLHRFHPAGRPTLLMIVGVATDGSDDGLLIGEVNPSFLWGAADLRPSMTDLFVIDPSTRLLYTSVEAPSLIPSESFANLPKIHAGRFSWEIGGKAHYASHTTLNLEPNFFYPEWIVVLSEPVEHILSPMATFTLFFPVLIVLSLGMVFFLSMGLIRKNLEPIEKLREATSKIAEGNLGQVVEIRTGDEFETLGGSFNEMSRRLKEGQALLIRSAKMATMGQMAAGIVHEIKQPLSAMYGLVQYMVASEPEGEQKEILATIMQSTERLTDIVSRFGSFSQMSAEALQGVAVAEVIERVRRLLVYQLDINRIRFLMDAPEDTPRIIGDFRSLEQVFSNLVINALHALENKPDGDRVIQVKIHASGDRVIVDVEDNGCGIPEQLIKRIFDPFFTTKSPEKGTGLGMAIVESILHKHNAGIQVKSRVDAGTKVSVTFPAFRAEETS